MDNSADAITSAVRSLRERAGLSMAAIARTMGFKGASSYQRYENPALYAGGYLPRDWVDGFRKAVVGKGSPPIEAREVWELAGPEFSPARVFTGFDPDGPPDAETDDEMTVGEHTGARNVPPGSIPQIDVTAGMGGGGLTVIREGVAGKSGMTFSAEIVRDFWRIPSEVLRSVGASPDFLAVLPVQGDSMQPTLHDGEWVVADTRHRWPSPDGIYALNDAFGGVVVKRLEVISKPGEEVQRVAVISDNPRHQRKEWTVEDLRIIGRVIWRFGNLQ